MATTTRGHAPRTILTLALAIAGLIGTLYWAYAIRYTEPDLVMWWRSTRFWLAGIDPYGHQADVLLAGPLADTRSGFAYPFPVILLTVPFALVPLPLAAALWSLISLGTVASLGLAIDDRGIGPGAVFALCYFPMWASLEEAQWAPILLTFAVLSLWLYRTRRSGWAGAIVPLVLLKPQVGLALMVGLMVHANVPHLNRRWWIGLLISSIILWGGSLIIAPTWPAGWMHQLSKYNSEGQNVIDASSPLGVLLLIVLVALAWRLWRRTDSIGLLAAVVTIVLLVLPTRSFYNHALLLLPISLIGVYRPRPAIGVALLSWATIVVGILSGNGMLARLLALYLPLIGLIALYAMGPSPRDRVEYSDERTAAQTLA